MKNIVIKSNKFAKMANNLEQTKIYIENNIKMLTLVERESKRLLARNNIVNLRSI